MAAIVKHSITGDMMRGAVAGAAGSWAMEKVTTLLMEQENEQAKRQEKQAQIEGKTAPELTAERISERTRLNVKPRQVHYAMGMLPAMFYGVLLDRVDRIGFARGLLYGASIFVLMDEMVTPAVGVANKPSAYPWQTHARGLAGHLVMGFVTYTVFKLLSR